MNCQNFRKIIHSYIDRELGLVHAAEAERHLEQCDECRLICRGQAALRSSLLDPSFYHRAPAHLKRRITSYFHQEGRGKPTAHSASSTEATPS